MVTGTMSTTVVTLSRRREKCRHVDRISRTPPEALNRRNERTAIQSNRPVLESMPAITIIPASRKMTFRSIAAKHRAGRSRRARSRQRRRQGDQRSVERLEGNQGIGNDKTMPAIQTSISSHQRSVVQRRPQPDGPSLAATTSDAGLEAARSSTQGRSSLGLCSSTDKPRSRKIAASSLAEADCALRAGCRRG